MGKAFRRFDQDGSGTVDRTEFALGLASIGFDPSGGDIKSMLDYVDVDKSGEVNYREFQRLVDAARNV